jgi:hypothetical protein
MPHIPYDFIVRGVKYVVQSYSQFYHTQAGSEMARIIAYNIYNELPELRTHLYKIGRSKLSQIIRSIYFRE